MAVARLIEIGDTLAGVIRTYLAGRDITCRVERVWQITVTDDDLAAWKAAAAEFTVFVIPGDESREMATRGMDTAKYPFTVVFVQQYTAQGDPTTAWLDDRILLASDVVKAVGEIRNPIDTTDGFRPAVAKHTETCDRQILQTQGMYWGEAEVEFHEEDVRA